MDSQDKISVLKLSLQDCLKDITDFIEVEKQKETNTFVFADMSWRLMALKSKTDSLHFELTQYQQFKKERESNASTKI